MTNLVKATDETGYRARADRSLQSGRVVSVDKKAHVAILDVGMVDNDGNGVYLHDVPFSPQSPPHENDAVAILRTSSSPYSHVVGGGSQVGGANSGQVVSNGGVMSLAKSGSAKLKDDVTLTAIGGATLAQVLQNIEIDGGLPTGGTAGQVLTKVDGSDYNVDWETVSGGGTGAPTTAHYLTSQSEAGLSAEVNLGALTTGILKHTVAAGVSTPATATLGTDYAGAPDGSTLETSGSATRIKDAGVTLAKIANIGDASILGNNTGGAAAPVALTAAQVRAILALVIGTNVQAWDADLDTIAGLAATTDNFMQAKAGAWASRTPTQATADLIAVVGDSGSGGTKGLVPAPASGDAAAGRFLKADGAWSTPSGTGAPADAHYVTTQAESGLSAESNLGALTTGLLKHTVSGGVSTPATAAAGTDYYNPGGTDVAVADGGTGSSTASGARTNLGVAVQSISLVLNNGTSALAVGQYVDVVAEYDCTITQATTLADQSGSCVIDLRKCTYAQFDDSTHPVSGDSICASAKPTLSSATKAQDATLTGWSTSLSAGDILRAYVESATSVTQVTISLKVTRA